MTLFEGELGSDDKFGWCNKDTTHETCSLKGLGGIENLGMAPCRFAPVWPVCNVCDNAHAYDVDPTGTLLYFIQFGHLLPFVTTALITGFFFYNLDTIKSRIGNLGCGLFNFGTCLLALGSLCEFANHALIMNWNQCYDSSDNFVNLLFYIFLSAGNSLLALGLRQAGTKFFRKLTCSFDGLNMLLDWVLIGLNILIIPVWMKYGRVGSASLFIPSQMVAGCLEFVRIWKHLGPEDMFSDSGKKYGLLSFCMEFLSIFLSIKVLHKMFAPTGKQWYHGILALTFGLNQLLLCACLHFAYPKKKALPVARGETRPLL